MNYFKSLGTYGFTMFFNAGISFATFSFLTHHLSEVDYGIINLYSSFGIFLIPFIGIGVQLTLGIDYFKMDENAFKNHFVNAMLIPVFSCLLLTFLFFLLNNYIQQFINVNFLFAVLLPLNCFLIISNEVVLNLIRNKGKHSLFAVFSICKNVMEIGLTSLLVIGAGLAWKGRLASSFIMLTVSGLAIYFLITKWGLTKGKFDKKRTKEIFINGLPFVPERLAIFALGYSDRFFINHFNGTADVGYYSAGAQIAVIVTLVILTLNSAFQPYLYKQLSQLTINYAAVRKATLAFIGICFLISVFVIVVSPYIFEYFVGRTFQSGSRYAVLLTIGMFFWGVYNLFIAYLLNLKKNNLIMFISVFGIVLSIILNYWNVKYFGAIGAAYTNIIVYSFMAIVAIYFVHRFYGLDNVVFFRR